MVSQLEELLGHVLLPASCSSLLLPYPETYCLPANLGGFWLQHTLLSTPVRICSHLLWDCEGSRAKLFNLLCHRVN